MALRFDLKMMMHFRNLIELMNLVKIDSIQQILHFFSFISNL